MGQVSGLRSVVIHRGKGTVWTTDAASCLTSAVGIRHAMDVSLCS